MRGLRRAAVAAAILGLLAASAASARQSAVLIGRVTRVSVPRHLFVIGGRVVHVRKTTVYALVGGGGLPRLAGKRVRVVVVGRPGRYFAVAVRSVRVAQPTTTANAKPTFTG